MTQPQDQPNTRGQRLDFSREGEGYGGWAGILQTGNFTLSVYADGLYSFKIDGVLVSFTAEPGDDANTATAGLLANYVGNTKALSSAFANIEDASPTLLRLRARSPGASFVISDVVLPGGATFVYADTTTQRGRLGLGIAVAFDDTDPESLRELTTGDTGATVVGVTMEGYEVAANSGDPAEEDGYDPGSPVSYLRMGHVPVPVETDITTLAAPVYVRIIAPGDEEIGAWRGDDDSASGNVVLVAGARWTLLSYPDEQGRNTAEIRTNFV